MIPESFWISLGDFIQVSTIFVALYLLSNIYRNVVEAHKKHIYNTVEYHDCDIEKEARR